MSFEKRSRVWSPESTLNEAEWGVALDIDPKPQTPDSFLDAFLDFVLDSFPALFLDFMKPDSPGLAPL